MNDPSVPFRCLLGLVFAVVLTTDAHATVTNVAWYRLGENDPGGVSGAIVNSTTLDLVGTQHLNRFGSPRYANAVSNAVGSSLAVNFDGSNQYFSNAVVSTAVDNFALEAWVKPNITTTGNRFIVCNGSTLADGWAIFQKGGGSYSATFGGVTSFGAATAVAGTWTHLALVRNNGATAFYVDGVVSGTSSGTPIPPATGFTVGTRPQGTAGQLFNGAVDEVRVFTFAAGQFSTNDLLFNLQRVATLPATGLASSNPTLNGRANPSGLPASAWFEWGTTTNYGNATSAQALGNGTSNTNFSQVLTGLDGGITYHFRAVASNNLGIAFGTNQSFTATPALLWYDGFDTGTGAYTVGAPLGGQAGGSGIFFTGAWVQPGGDDALVMSNSLSMVGQAQASVGGSVGDNDVSNCCITSQSGRQFAQPWTNFNGTAGTFYMGFLADFGGPVTSDPHHRVLEMWYNGYGNSDRNLMFGYSTFEGLGTQLSLAVKDRSANTFVIKQLSEHLEFSADGKTHLIVLKFVLNDTERFTPGADTVSVFLDPVGTTEPVTSSATISSADFPGGGLDLLLDRMGTISQFSFTPAATAATFDELRVGTTFAAVANLASSKPHITGIVRSGTNLIINGTNGTPNGTYHLIMSTNLATARTNWTPVATNTFDGNGRFTNTVPMSGPRQFISIRQLP